MLTQFEAIRLTMLTARAGGARTEPADQFQANDQLCDQAVSSIESAPAIGLTEGQISEKAWVLYQCAMSDFRKGGDKWFLRTGQARMKLLEEIVARQADAGIGEHRGNGATGKQ